MTVHYLNTASENFGVCGWCGDYAKDYVGDLSLDICAVDCLECLKIVANKTGEPCTKTIS